MTDPLVVTAAPSTGHLRCVVCLKERALYTCSYCWYDCCSQCHHHHRHNSLVDDHWYGPYHSSLFQYREPDISTAKRIDHFIAGMLGNCGSSAGKQEGYYLLACTDLSIHPSELYYPYYRRRVHARLVQNAKGDDGEVVSLVHQFESILQDLACQPMLYHLDRTLSTVHGAHYLKFLRQRILNDPKRSNDSFNTIDYFIFNPSDSESLGSPILSANDLAPLSRAVTVKLKLLADQWREQTRGDSMRQIDGPDASYSDPVLERRSTAWFPSSRVSGDSSANMDSWHLPSRGLRDRSSPNRSVFDSTCNEDQGTEMQAVIAESLGVLAQTQPAPARIPAAQNAVCSPAPTSPVTPPAPAPTPATLDSVYRELRVQSTDLALAWQYHSALNKQELLHHEDEKLLQESKRQDIIHEIKKDLEYVNVSNGSDEKIIALDGNESFDAIDSDEEHELQAEYRATPTDTKPKDRLEPELFWDDNDQSLSLDDWNDVHAGEEDWDVVDDEYLWAENADGNNDARNDSVIAETHRHDTAVTVASVRTATIKVNASGSADADLETAMAHFEAYLRATDTEQYENGRPVLAKFVPTSHVPLLNELPLQIIDPLSELDYSDELKTHTNYLAGAITGVTNPLTATPPETFDFNVNTGHVSLRPLPPIVSQSSATAASAQPFASAVFDAVCEADSDSGNRDPADRHDPALPDAAGSGSETGTAWSCWQCAVDNEPVNVFCAECCAERFEDAVG